MGLKRKQVLIEQKARLEQALKTRLAYLSGKGIESPRADKDTLVRKIQGDIRAVNNRLAKIAGDEKRTEELKKMKAEKAAGPKVKKEGEKAEKGKKAPEEGKEKKAKPEKKPGPPKGQEGGKSPKPAEAQPEGKPAPKKKAEQPNEKPAE
jgi:outer membrane biosynthesis protein TonB